MSDEPRSTDPLRSTDLLRSTDRLDDPEVSGSIPSATVAAAAGQLSRTERRRRADRDILQLAWPAVVSQLLASFVSLVDIAMLGRLGTESLAAVGYAAQFFHLAQSCLLALGIACVAQMARSIGAGDPARARQALATSIALAFVASAVITAIVLIFPRELLLLLNATPEIAEIAVPYFRLTIGSTTILAIALMYESGFRAAKNTRTPLRIAMWVTGIKLVLNGLLIFGAFGLPRMELVGAGLATVASQIFAIVAFVYMSRRATEEVGSAVRLRRADFAGIPAMLPETLRLALPALGERLGMNLALMTYFWILGDYGPVAIAAYTVGVRALSFSWIPGVGLSVASSTLVGQALGAHDPRTAVRAGWRSARLALFISAIMGVVFILTRVQLARLFTNDPQVIAAIEPFMLVLALAQPFLGLHFTLGGALRGAGDTMTPLWAAVAGNWMFRVPLAFAAARIFELDVFWVWVPLLFDHLIRAGWITWAFRRGHWTRNLGLGVR